MSWPALLTASTTVVALATPHWLCTVTSHGRASIASYTLGGTVARADTTISPARPSHWTEKQKRITSRIFSFSLSIYRLATARTHRSTPTQDVPSNSRRIESRAPSPITNILIIRALRGGGIALSPALPTLLYLFLNYPLTRKRPVSKQQSDVTPYFLGTVLAKLVIKFSFVPGPELFMRPLDGYDTRALGR